MQNKPPKRISEFKIARISTISFVMATLLREQLSFLKDCNLNLTIISGVDKGMDIIESMEINFVQNSFSREINLVKDLLSLFHLWLIFRRKKFDLVHSITPKAGLLTSIASYFSKIPIRIHTFTGLRWINMTGFKRFLLKNLDRLLILLNTNIYADSFFQRDFLLKEGLISDISQIKVIGEGSLAGVDLQRFSYALEGKKSGRKYKDLEINPDAFIFLFLGRITKDKGIYELIESFENISSKKEANLIIVGPLEIEEKYKKMFLEKIDNNSKIIIRGFTSRPEEYYSFADVLCLPSYREGFGTAILEAAAMKVPCIGTKITGLEESIINGKTGILVEKGNISELTHAMEKLMLDESLRNSLSVEAYNRVRKDFDSRILNKILLEDYKNLLESI